MLRKLSIRSFKAYAKVEDVPIAPFSVIIGANGAGKSTVLQAIDLMGGLVRGTLSEYLSARGWSYRELPHFLSDRAEFEVAAELDDGLTWSLTLGKRRRPGIAQELISRGLDLFMIRVGRSMNRFPDDGGEGGATIQTLTSSWLATIDAKDDAARFPALVACSTWARGIRSYLFSPDALRSAGVGGANEVGETGRDLPSYLRRIKRRHPDRFEAIVQRVRKRMPRVRDISVKVERGVSTIEVTEKWGSHTVTLSAQQVSDGLLRLLAVSAAHPGPDDPSSLLLLDEIENGMHPHLLGVFMDMLQDMVADSNGRVQVIATTHSPIALNFVRDAQGVLLVHRKASGAAITPLTQLEKYPEWAANYDLGELWYNVGEELLLGEEG